MYVDIHCHILPGIDDGAQTINDSVAMARKAFSEGISHILCTPHHNNGTYLNKKENVIRQVADLQAVLDEKKIPVTLYEGQEVRISTDILSRIAQNEILFADLDDTYILIEFPILEIPNYAHNVLFELCSNGYCPIIVHPERNKQIIQNPNLIIPFIEMGCLTQVTEGSYLGEFGSDVKKVTRIMIENNLAYMIASDAHNLHKRGFHTKVVYNKLEEEYGYEKTSEFKKIAKQVINGDKVEFMNPKVYKKRFRFFS